MAYNNGREDRKWRVWKEAGEKVLQEHGIDESTIGQIYIDDRADFNFNRRFYHWTSSTSGIAYGGQACPANSCDENAGGIYTRLDHLRKKLRKIL